MLFCYSLAKASENDSIQDTSKNYRKWHWGIYFSGNFCYRYYKNIPSLNKNYNPRFCYNIGVTVEKQLTKRIFFNTGLIIRNHNLQTNDSDYNPINGSTWVYRDCAIYGSAPLQIKYQFFPKNECSLFVGFGIAPCFKIYGKEFEVYNNGLSIFEYYFVYGGESYYVPVLEGFGSLGLVFNNSKTKVVIAPYFNYTLTSLTSEHIYSKGFALNIVF